MTAVACWVRSNRWCWAGVAIVILWLALGIGTSRFGISTLSGIVASAAFLAIVAFGQTFVVASGRANIDLSVAGTITLAAYLAMHLSDGSGLGMAASIGIVLVLGIVVGLLNGLLVAYLRLPAIVVTLAVGYILATGALLANEQMPPTVVAPLLTQISNGRFLSIPIMVFVAIGLLVLAEVLWRNTAFGRQLTALGQSESVAAHAGISVNLITICCFVISALAASVTGLLLSARVGGAFLDIGTPFLLQSVGAVVIGGTSMLGGYATFIGTFLGSVLLFLIVMVMQVTGLPVGVQEIMQGVGITLILAFASTAK